MGGTLHSLGNLEEARAACERDLQFNETFFGPNHPNIAADLTILGSILWDMGDLEGARAAYERALSIFEANLPPDHPSIKDVRQALESLG